MMIIEKIIAQLEQSPSGMTANQLIAADPTLTYVRIRDAVFNYRAKHGDQSLVMSKVKSNVATYYLKRPVAEQVNFDRFAGWGNAARLG